MAELPNIFFLFIESHRKWPTDRENYSRSTEGRKHDTLVNR